MLMEAVNACYSDLVEMLVEEFHADVNIKAIKTGYTALHLAVAFEQSIDILEILLHHGADINAINKVSLSTCI
jgi:ankyrin repeat protein